MQLKTANIAAAVLLAVAVAAGGPVWAAASAPLTARVTFAQDPGAFVYLRFDKNRLRVARTLGALDSAQPVRSKSGEINSTGRAGDFFQYYNFPPVDLPVTVHGLDKVSGEFNFNRNRYTDRRGGTPQEYAGISGRVAVATHAGGATWGYVVQVSQGTRPGAQSTTRFDLNVPKLDAEALTFAIETKVEGRKARIGMRIKSGKQEIYTITKNGKGTPVKLEVLDKNRKTIVSEQGDPLKFGFT